MFTFKHSWAVFLLLIISLSAVFAPILLSANMQGWEEDGAYNKLYKSSELDKFKCTIKKIVEVVPMDGMSSAVALIVDEGDGEEVVIHVGPKWFLGDTALKRGDRIKVRGAWAEIDGEEVFLAAKIKKGDFFELKVRLTKNGKPFWAMTPEELAKEQSQ